MCIRDRPFAVLVGEPLPAAFLEPTVELLQVVLCQLIQRDVPNLRNDMQADAALIGLLRGGPDLGLGVVLVPVCQPIPEGDVYKRQDPDTAGAGGGCAAWFLLPSQSCRVDDCRSASVPPEILQPSPMSIQRGAHLVNRGECGF